MDSLDRWDRLLFTAAEAKTKVQKMSWEAVTLRQSWFLQFVAFIYFQITFNVCHVIMAPTSYMGKVKFRSIILNFLHKCRLRRQKYYKYIYTFSAKNGLGSSFRNNFTFLVYQWVTPAVIKLETDFLNYGLCILQHSNLYFAEPRTKRCTSSSCSISGWSSGQT